MATLIPNNPAIQLASPGTITGGSADKAFQAADVVGGNAFIASGDDLLIVFNSDSAPHNITIKSVADSFGRFADVTYAVAAGHYAFINITPAALYTQTNGEVLLQADSTLLGLMVVMNA